LIRIIVDKLGSGHADLFLKIDNFPTYSKTGDSYYLLDFLEIDEDEIERLNLSEENWLKYATSALVDYWNKRIAQSKKGNQIFLPFDFQDEYIGGLLLNETAQGYKTNVGYSPKIRGYEVNKSVFDEVLSERKIEFQLEENAEWRLSHKQIFDGLEWSKNELRINE